MTRGEEKVLIDFWATWRAPRKAAMPGIQQLSDKFMRSQTDREGAFTPERAQIEERLASKFDRTDATLPPRKHAEWRFRRARQRIGQCAQERRLRRRQAIWK